MWNEPSEEQLKKLPKLYSTDESPLKDKIIHMHYFIGGCDWYVAEYDQRDRLFFGYAILNNDLYNSEWGFSSLDELKAINVRGIEVDRDLHWRIRPVSEVEKIVEAYRIQNRSL